MRQRTFTTEEESYVVQGLLALWPLVGDDERKVIGGILRDGWETLTDGSVSLAERFNVVETRLTSLEEKRKVGRPKGSSRKPIKVTARDVCGIDPERDSATCPDASLYRRRQGCDGIGCRQKSSDYYKRHR